MDLILTFSSQGNRCAKVNGLASSYTCIGLCTIKYKELGFEPMSSDTIELCTKRIENFTEKVIQAASTANGRQGFKEKIQISY